MTKHERCAGWGVCGCRTAALLNTFYLSFSSKFICVLRSRGVRWMIIAFHVSLWRINIFHMRTYLPASSITLRRSARQALRQQREKLNSRVMIDVRFSSNLSCIEHSRKSHSKHFFCGISLHSLNGTSLYSWHLHFDLSIPGRSDNLIPLTASHSLYLRFSL